MASAGSLIFELAADVSRLRTDMQKAQQEMNASLATIAKASIASAALMGANFAKAFAEGIADHLKEAIDQADALGKLAQRAGTTVETLSILQRQGEKAGVSADDLAAAFRGLSKAMIDARDPSSNAASAITALGLNVDDLKRKDPAQAMKDIAQAMSGFKDGADKVEVARAILGKTGDVMIPMLNDGAKGFDDAAEKAAKLGVVVATETSKAASDFNDQLSDMKAMGDGLWNKLAENLLPTLQDTAKYFIEAANDGTTFKAVLEDVADAGAFAARVLIGTNAIISGTAKLASKFFEANDTGFDVNKQQQWRKEMTSTWESVRDDMTKAYEAQSKIKQARADARAGITHTNADQQQTEKHTQKELNYGAALDESAKKAKKAKKAKEALTDYQRMLQQLDTEYRKLAADGDPMKELLSDPKYQQMTKAQQQELANRTARNVDLKVAIDARTQAQENAQSADDTAYKVAADGMKAEYDRIDALWAFGDAQSRAVDPMIQYTETVQNLNDALAAGAILPENYTLALKKAGDDLAQAKAKTDPWLQQLEQIKDAVNAFGKKSSDAFVDFIFATKDASVSFSEMVTSILKDMAKMLTYQNVFQPLMKVVGAGVTGGGWDWSSLLNAKGMMSGGPVEAGSLYQVNELPGRREYFIPNVPGRIATDAGVPNAPNVQVNVHMHGDRDDRTTTDTKADERNAAELGKRIATVVRQVISTEKRTGGLLRS